MNTFIMTLSFLLTTLFGCQQNNGYKSLSVDDFETAIKNPDIQLLDVRSAAEFAAGHIPNAGNIDVTQSDFAANANDELVKDKVVAVYCRSGKRSKMAADILTKEGFKVIELNHGFMGWEDAGKKIAK